MSPAETADDLRAVSEEAVIFLGADVAVSQRLPEARPASPGIELGLGAEELVAAGCAQIHALFMHIPVFSREGLLRTFFPEDVEGVGREGLFPFGVRLGYFLAFHSDFIPLLENGERNRVIGGSGLDAAESKQ